MVYLAKKIGQAHILWFQASNQWVKFDEQQWFIFCLFKKNTSPEETVSKLCKQFPIKESAAKNTVENIYISIEELSNPNFLLPNLRLHNYEVENYTIQESKSRYYSYQGKAFKIVYGSASVEKYIHLPLAHLEANLFEDKIYTIEVFPYAERYFLRIEGDSEKTVSTETSGQIKHQLYVELANFFYNKTETDWLAFMHASAVEYNGKGLVLSSAGGSGKSTMAGLLQTKGFKFLSDDFVPIASNNLKIYTFPAALSLKGESIELLRAVGLNVQIAPPGKIAFVKPLQPQLRGKHRGVNVVVFVKYNNAVDLIFEPIPLLDALPKLIGETWVGNDILRAKRFIGWFTRTKFYQLEYGNSNKAINALTDLMEKL